MEFCGEFLPVCRVTLETQPAGPALVCNGKATQCCDAKSSYGPLPTSRLSYCVAFALSVATCRAICAPADGVDIMTGGRAGPRALLMGFLVVVSWHVAFAADPPEQQAVPVQTAAARVQTVPVLLPGLGTVQPLNVVQIRAQVNGTLVALPVQEGQKVHAGDVLAAI